MRLAWLVAVACLLPVAAGCGSADEPAARIPVAAPEVTLTDADRMLWAPGPSLRRSVPVILYASLEPERFARHMTLLERAGYETIPLADLVRFVRREPVDLPPTPFVLTFDGGRLETWVETDETLRKLGFGAVLFVDVGPIEEGDRRYLTWEELNAMQRSGRWDIQLRSGTGNRLIRYGPRPDETGPFYAYRGSQEVLGGWRERVFSDITYGEDQLAFHVRGYRPLAFAPPFGNYGQAGTNDPRIPRLVLERLHLSFELVFTQDRSGFARRGARNPLGRITIGSGTDDGRLHVLLQSD